MLGEGPVPRKSSGSTIESNQIKRGTTRISHILEVPVPSMSSYSTVDPNQINTVTTSTQRSPRPLSRLVAAGILVLYVVTGIAQPILIDTLRIRGLLGRSWLLLPTLANTMGMAACGLLTRSSQRMELRRLLTSSAVPWRRSSASENDVHKRIGSTADIVGANRRLLRMILIAAFVDLLSGMCLTFGLLTTGGTIFIVLYNSCPIWTTLLSWKFLPKFSIGWVSLMGVLMVTFGVIVNVFGSQLSRHEEDEKNDEITSQSSSSIYTGSFVILVGSLFHSLMFVLSDLTLRPECTIHKDGVSNVPSQTSTKQQYETGHKNEIHQRVLVPTGFLWSFCLGTIESFLMLLWVVIGVLVYGFRDEEHQLATEDSRHTYNGTSGDNGRKPINVAWGFILLVVVDSIHAATFFSILQQVGAVGSALLKGAQVIVVVALSSMFFCSPTDESQCLTYTKAYSVIFVSLGVFCYGYGNESSVHGCNKDENNYSQSLKKTIDSEKNILPYFNRKRNTKETELQILP